MAMDFPNSPTVNQTFTVGDKTWKWTGTVWEIVVNRPAMRSVSDTPPANPIVGDEWFNSLTGKTYTWFDSYWIEVNSNSVVGASGLNGVASATSPLVYNSTNNNISLKTSPVFTGDGTNNIAEFKDSAGLTRTWVNSNGSELYVGGNSASSGSVQIGHGATGNQYAYIDLIGDTTYSDYGFRLIRLNGGPNTTTGLEHRGTGAMNLQASEGVIRMTTANASRFELANNGHITMSAQPMWNSDITSQTNGYSTFTPNTNVGFTQTNSSTITVQTAGQYYVKAQQLMQTSGGGYWQLQKNNSTFKHGYVSTSIFYDVSVGALIYMNAGDTFRIYTAITLSNSWNGAHSSLDIMKVA